MLRVQAGGTGGEGRKSQALCDVDTTGAAWWTRQQDTVDRCTREVGKERIVVTVAVGRRCIAYRVSRWAVLPCCCAVLCLSAICALLLRSTLSSLPLRRATGF